MLGLLLLELVCVCNPSLDESWELIGRHHADGVEVEVAAVPARRLRMEDVGALHAKLTLKNVGDQRVVQVGSAQCLLQHGDELILGEVTDW